MEFPIRHKLSYFLSGLKDEIGVPKRQLNSINFSPTLGLAKVQEEYVLSSRKALRTIINGVDN